MTWSLWGKREFVWVLLEQHFTKFRKGGELSIRDQLIGPIKKSAIFITDRLAIYNFTVRARYLL